MLSGFKKENARIFTHYKDLRSLRRGFERYRKNRHPSTPFRMKEEIEPQKVKAFIESIDNMTVKCAALFLASSGLRKNEVLGLRNRA